jgi:hypothetical protein
VVCHGGPSTVMDQCWTVGLELTFMQVAAVWSMFRFNV